MRIGFIGLGHMGAPMAQNLLRAGHELVVYNRTAEKTKPLAAAGARVAKSPADLAGAEVIVTMLADDAAVESVAGGGFGSAIHLSMSTISAALAMRLARAGGASFVSAPVLGRPEAAAAAKLFLVAAGPRAALDRCQPIFDAVAQKTFVLGEDPALANVMKLAGNFLLASTIEAMAEMFALVRKWGLDPAQALEVLTTSVFTAPIHKGYGEKLVRPDGQVGFALTLGLKDVRLVLDAANAKGVPMPTASVVHDQLTAGLGRGLGREDWSVLGRLVAENAGLAPPQKG